MIRLLKHSTEGEFKLISFNDNNPPPYAILSHTWTEGQEVTYDELVASTGKDKTGYTKIRFCVGRAAADGLEYSWVDTCCINKSTSDELSTAINSMFRWYQRASKCYVYLSDVQVPDEVINAQVFRITWEGAFQRSRWFTRGWTLQELLAPATVEFFSNEGTYLGNRTSLEQEIHDITKIPIGALRGQSLTEFNFEERMSWVAKRTTTLKEDKVYCLLGIFGVFLSLIYGEGEAYATLRLREEIQKREKGRGIENLRNLTVFTLLPFPRNELFVGREDQLQSLEQFLLSDTHRITIYGLGGCGKSALALEFAYRALARHTRRLVFWVPAISPESFELAYREIGICLCIPGITEDNADIKQLVKNTLSSDSVGPWLMIIDNANDPEVLIDSIDGDPRSARLSDYLPYSHRGKILFTTRSRKAASDLTQSRVLELKDMMSKAEARQLLAQRIENQALLNNEKAVSELLELLTYLPLAIIQAAAFISNNQISISGYITLLQQADTQTELFSEHFKDPSRYRGLESTIAKTWHISFDQICRQDPLASVYLSFMACIDHINIPQTMLPPGGSLLQQVKALGTLKGYAFVSERQRPLHSLESEKFFDMHQLVHMASVWWLDEHGGLTAWTAKAAARLETLIPYGGHQSKEIWITYLPHAIHVARLDSMLDKRVRASLLDRIGRCQASLGQYSAAETTHRRVLSLREKNLGKEYDQTLTSMNEVIGALEGQGKYEDAELMNRQMLVQCEKALGPEHLSTLTSMSNLAGVLSRQGKYEEAELMNRKTLTRYEKVLGSEHPCTLTSMGNLAQVLNGQGKYEEAESMNRKTLARKEKVLGPEHPDTLTSMSNLALVLDYRGNYDEAESVNKQMLARKERVLGPEHPSTLTSMGNLAVVLNNQGKYEEAESMTRQALTRKEKVLGPEHPDMLVSMGNLAGMLNNQGKYKEGESINRQVLAQCEKVLGPEHPYTLMSMSNLAGVLNSQGKYKEAELMYRQTLARHKKVLGPEHPDTLASMYSLAYLLANQDHYKESSALYRRAYAGYSAVLGKDHPTTRSCHQHYFRTLGLQVQDPFILISKKPKL
ncbi:kinesin light chain 1 [Patellaria atrata CBS 101060]|uniref:Kinesin light chain 1 n=1 Tax=Patellaria atrata CBS 101060 TaxID=1346257 RepID=A0A9P4VM61_9PEZI|nr:kinesin light chain 1 [Patellaria atrata CBS 101060]KAF2842573.1 kinesin light chain 1 [Patellaria atrata CBS 101060]